MKKSTANPATERSTGQKATGTARAQAPSTWTGARGWASSPKVFNLTGRQQIQTLLNLLRNMEVLRSVPDVGIPYTLPRRSLELESPGTKTVSDVLSAGRVLSQQLWLRKKVKSIVKDATRRTSGPRDLATAKEQGPLFMLSRGANPEPRKITHWESLHNLGTDNLTLNYCEILQYWSTVCCPVLG